MESHSHPQKLEEWIPYIIRISIQNFQIKQEQEQIKITKQEASLRRNFKELMENVCETPSNFSKIL